MGWDPEAVLSQIHDGPEGSRHQAPPPKDCLPAAHSCARKSTTWTPALPFLCWPLCNGQLWKPGGGTAELCSMGLEGGEHQEAGQSQLSLSAVPSTPVLVGSRAALMVPRWTPCPFQGGRPRGQLGRFHHSDSFRVCEAFPLWS